MKDDILKMAREAGLQPYYEAQESAIQRFADLVRAADRQRLADKFLQMHDRAKTSHNYWAFAANFILEDSEDGGENPSF